MWTFVIRGGRLFHNGKFMAIGYSGLDNDNVDDADDAKNNPDMQSVKNVGPIPVGLWKIVGQPYDHKTLGKYVMNLEPVDVPNLYGRDAFRIHGDSVANPGTASHGCIILARNWRQAIWESGDRELLVVADEIKVEDVTVS